MSLQARHAAVMAIFVLLFPNGCGVPVRGKQMFVDHKDVVMALHGNLCITHRLITALHFVVF